MRIIVPSGYRVQLKMSELAPSINCVGPASPSPTSPIESQGKQVTAAPSQLTVAVKPVRLSEKEYASLPPDVCNIIHSQDLYINSLEERLNCLEGR